MKTVEKTHTFSRFAIVTIAMAALLEWGLVLNDNTGTVEIPAGELFRIVFD